MCFFRVSERHLAGSLVSPLRPLNGRVAALPFGGWPRFDEFHVEASLNSFDPHGSAQGSFDVWPDLCGSPGLFAWLGFRGLSTSGLSCAAFALEEAHQPGTFSIIFPI